MAAMKEGDSQGKVLDVAFPRHAVDEDAHRAVLRLQKEGYTTYLVGGGVRDLLLGRKPKDFDISTAASPRAVRGLFRNARLIGKRFQIVHLRFGPRIFEVSRFRKRVVPEDGEMREPLASENTWGEPADDACARDFTVNALFYDPGTEQVIDHVGGYEDLKAGVLRSVGDPMIWYYEDPVRILRAAKFAGRLGFTLPDEERAAMRARAALLHICPPSRVTEEMFRILEGGASSPSYRVLWETGVLAELFPELNEVLEEESEGGGEPETLRYLTQLDRLVLAHGGLPRELLFSALFHPSIRRRMLAARERGEEIPPWGHMAEDWLQERAVTLHIPRAYRARQRVLMSILGRLETSERVRLGRLPRQPAFPDLMTLLRLHERVWGGLAPVYNTLRRHADELGANVVPPGRRAGGRIAQRDGASGERRVQGDRRRGRGRRRGGRPSSPPPAAR